MRVGEIMKDKKLLVYLLVLAIVILITIVLGIIVKNNQSNYADSIRFKEEYESMNDSVPMTIDEDNPIKYLDYEGVEELLTSGTGVIYFGFPSCPWCRNVIPVLFDVADKNNWDTIYYANPRELKSDETKYNKLLDILSEYLRESEGKKVLYVPDVYFVKDGKIVGHHISTVESQTDPTISLTVEQVEELSNIYQSLFDQIK